MDPTGADSPYIYDNFEWPHCVDEGYSVDLMEQTGLPDSNVKVASLPNGEKIPSPWPQVPPYKR